MIENNVKLGKNPNIFDSNLVNIWKCEIGDNVVIGPFVEITNGVKIGNNCKIESHSFLCTGVTLEDEVFIGHGTMFVNDHYPKTNRQVKKLETLVKKGVGVGTNATILGGVTIGRYSIIGSGAVVTKNVPDFSIVVGNPAKIIKLFKSLKELNSYIESRSESL